MIDLHCHTTASDGLMIPSDIVKHAIHEGLKVLAIADHDTVTGLHEANQAAEEIGICFIPAIELSIEYPTGSFHLLGYDIDYKNQELLDQLAILKSIREARILRIIKRLNQIGIELTIEDVKEESRGAVPGKPHVARVLVKKGYAIDVDSAIKKYLNRGMPGYVKKEKINPESAFNLIISAGGLPVLAHPISLKCKDPGEYDRIIESFIRLGLVGIEVYASLHEDADVKLFAEIAERHNLIATGGSDFHGEDGDRLGYYGGCRIIPESCAKSLVRVKNNNKNKGGKI
jgi:3',5'-nucleoside bisphosphate phosphatase